MKSTLLKMFLLVLAIANLQACRDNAGAKTDTGAPAETEAPQVEVANFSGTYGYDNGENGGGELRVEQKGSEIEFSIRIVAGPPAYNQGSLVGKAALKDNVAEVNVQDYGDCRFTITFSENEARIVSDENARSCGFGNGVIADGVYKKK